MDTNLKEVKKNLDDVDQEISAARVEDVMSIKKAEMEIHKVRLMKIEGAFKCLKKRC